ncbi:hypothetical protein [Streptomyces celluloflavus]|uniref:hypothetical protein n=1 Tax=Streptomyces celluloflavus TaxID=58344 RepID=UPI00367EFE9F
MHQLDRLRAEDAPEFERILDRALSSQEIKDAVRRTAGALNAEQLRTQALRARADIAAAASAEYGSYLRLRISADRSRPPQAATGTTSRTGGGLLPALAVLVPGLAIVAAAVFLLFGFGLRVIGAYAHLADELVFAGLTSAGVAVATTALALLWLFVTAARNRSAPDGRTAGGGAAGGADRALAQAREAWQLALLERGIMPFLRGRADDARTGRTDGAAGLPAPPRAPADPVNATNGGKAAPRKSGPGFTAPDFASPDFASPDFASPDFSSPDFASPDFSSPDFGSPDFTGPDARSGKRRE